jgi:CRISPR-associated endonuclease Csy4
MDHYVDVRLQPDAEFAPAMLMAALFTKLHKALAAGAHHDIGASFPQVQEVAVDAPAAKPSRTGAHPAYRLGLVLRLHGTASALAVLIASDWLRGMRDHVLCGPVQVVPAKHGYRAVNRVQAKSNPERVKRRLVKRLMQREGFSEAQAQARIPDSDAETLDLPFLTLRSQSTAQTFRLFIRHGPIQPEPVQGTFGAYGLSPATTVPWF